MLQPPACGRCSSALLSDHGDGPQRRGNSGYSFIYLTPVRFKFLSCHYSEEQSHLGILRMRSGKLFLITVAGLARHFYGTGSAPRDCKE
jgi:hypothetical protein